MGILDFLRSDKNTRKVFVKRELKIIEKQLYGVSLTQSEKNRLSRDMRKKCEFIKEAEKFASEFDLKKGEYIKKILDETQEIIQQDSFFQKIKRIILYGSTMQGKRALISDIDLAVEFEDIALKDATLFRQRIAGRCNSLIDLQVYNVLPDKIKKEIRYGKVLYEKKNSNPNNQKA